MDCSRWYHHETTIFCFKARFTKDIALIILQDNHRWPVQMTLVFLSVTCISASFCSGLVTFVLKVCQRSKSHDMVKLHLSQKEWMKLQEQYSTHNLPSWFERELILTLISICGMSLVVLWVTLYLVFYQTDCCLRCFNGASSLSVHRDFVFFALCWTRTVRNHRLGLLQQKVICCFAVSIPHGEYQVFDCLSTLLLRLAAATIYESLGMTRLSCHQLSKDVIIFILMVAISAGVCEFDFLFAVRLIYIERGHCWARCMHITSFKYVKTPPENQDAICLAAVRDEFQP